MRLELCSLNANGSLDMIQESASIQEECEHTGECEHGMYRCHSREKELLPDSVYRSHQVERKRSARDDNRLPTMYRRLNTRVSVPAVSWLEWRFRTSGLLQSL